MFGGNQQKKYNFRKGFQWFSLHCTSLQVMMSQESLGSANAPQKAGIGPHTGLFETNFGFRNPCCQIISYAETELSSELPANNNFPFNSIAETFEGTRAFSFPIF